MHQVISILDSEGREIAVPKAGGWEHETEEVQIQFLSECKEEVI